MPQGVEKARVPNLDGPIGALYLSQQMCAAVEREDLSAIATELDDLRARLHRRATLPSPAARRAIRLAAGATLDEVARAVGVSHEAIRLYEAGRRFPKDANLARYAACLAALQQGLGGDTNRKGVSA